MSELKRVERIESTPFQTHSEQNVHGWERAGSVAGGIVMMGKGLRRGGIFGLSQLAIGGAAVGFIAGLLAPSTRMEDERIGPMADDVKATAADAGREALERGKDVVQEAGATAIETAKERGREEGEELSESLQEKAREVAPREAPTSRRDT